MIKLSEEKKIDGIKVYKSKTIHDYFGNIDINSFFAKRNNLNAHGKTIKEAISSLIFKEQYELGAEENAKRVVETGKVNMNDYRLLTGSCEFGVKQWLDERNLSHDTEFTIKEAIDLVKKDKAYHYDVFIKNLEEVGYHND